MPNFAIDISNVSISSSVQTLDFSLVSDSMVWVLGLLEID